MHDDKKELLARAALVEEASSGGNDLTARSFKAMSWGYLGVLITVALQTIGSIFIARYLGPRITGVFAFGLVIFAPFKLLCEFGFGSALVEKRDLADQDVDMALSRSTLLALCTSVVWLLLLRPLAPLAHQGEHVAELSIFALVLLSYPVQGICTAILTKKLEQRYLQVSSLIAYTVGYLGVAILGALAGWGAWSLVLGFLAQNLISTTMLLVHPGIPMRITLKGDAGFLWRFGGRATVINISNWLTSSADNIAVAFFFGPVALGVYSVAYNLVRTPTDKLVTTLQNVLFPVSTHARNDKVRLARASIAVIDAVILITAPVFCAIAALSGTLVDAVYGADWRDASFTLPPFALSMIFQSLIVVCSALLWGSGGVRRDMRIQWISAGIFVIAVLAAAQISFTAVAWTVLPITLMRATFGILALVKVLDIQRRRIARAFFAGGLLAFLITPVLLAADSYMRQGAVTASVRLAWEIAIGAVLWVGIVSLAHSRLVTSELETIYISLRHTLAGSERRE